MDTYNFSASLVKVEKMGYQGFFIPGDVVETMGIKGITRVIGTVNGAAYRRATISNGDGRYYIIMGKDLRKAAGSSLGQTLEVSIELDPNPDFIDVPEEFEAALDTDPEALEIWNGFTLGYQRSLVHYVSDAKRVETRIKRALDLCEKMKRRELHGQK